MTPACEKLLRDLWSLAIPVERRAWRLQEYVRKNELAESAMQSLLQSAPVDLRVYLERLRISEMNK